MAYVREANLAASFSGVSRSFAALVPALAEPMTSFFVLGAPAADLHLRHLLGRADPRMELQQVLAEDQLEGVLGAQVALARTVLRGLRLAKVQLAVADRQLETDLGSASLEEVPIREVHLGDVVVRGLGVVDLAGL
jgi:hypothetical protein